MGTSLSNIMYWVYQVVKTTCSLVFFFLRYLLSLWESAFRMRTSPLTQYQSLNPSALYSCIFTWNYNSILPNNRSYKNLNITHILVTFPIIMHAFEMQHFPLYSGLSRYWAKSRKSKPLCLHSGWPEGRGGRRQAAPAEQRDRNHPTGPGLLRAGGRREPPFPRAGWRGAPRPRSRPPHTRYPPPGRALRWRRRCGTAPPPSAAPAPALRDRTRGGSEIRPDNTAAPRRWREGEPGPTADDTLHRRQPRPRHGQGRPSASLARREETGEAPLRMRTAAEHGGPGATGAPNPAFPVAPRADWLSGATAPPSDPSDRRWDQSDGAADRFHSLPSVGRRGGSGRIPGSGPDRRRATCRGCSTPPWAGSTATPTARSASIATSTSGCARGPGLGRGDEDGGARDGGAWPGRGVEQRLRGEGACCRGKALRGGGEGEGTAFPGRREQDGRCADPSACSPLPSG